MEFDPYKDAVVTRWYVVRAGAIVDNAPRYKSRDQALTAVGARNAVMPGHTALGIPTRIVACEGCPNALLDCIYDTDGARELTRIEWRHCYSHAPSWENEQTPMIASWVYDY